MKNFNIFGVHRKIQFLGGEGHEKPIERGDCLKRGCWRMEGGGAWQEEGCWYTNAHYVVGYLSQT